MNRLTQSFQLLRMSLLSLPARTGPSLVVIIGMAGVVAVVIAMMAAASTFDNTLRRSGHEDRAIVLRKGSVAELTSAIPRDALPHIADAPGVRRGAAGAALISAEALAATTLHRRSDDTEAAGQVRGVGSTATLIRPELHIVAGRYFRPGAFAALGALCGAALAFIVFNGRTFGSNLTGSPTSQLIFQIDMVRSYFVTGLVLACVVSMAGALIPAVRAARIPVATALRRG